jgi:PAS domain S-box-containing protein
MGRDYPLEMLYRDLVEGSIQGIFIVQGKRVVFANSAFAEMMGYATVEEIYDLPDAFAMVAPEDRARIAGYAKARQKGGKAPERYEMCAIRANGDRAWQEIIARPVQWDGAPAFQISVVDITERKKAEESLRASEVRFRNLIEGSIQGIFVHKDFKLLFANRAMAEMLGYDGPDDLLNLDSVLNFVHPEEHARTTGFKNARLAGEETPERYEFRAIRRNGSTLWLENVAQTVNWDGVDAIQATVVDITERKQAERALRESEANLKEAQRIANVGSFRNDFGGKGLIWSDQIFDIFGVAQSDGPLSNETFMAMVHPNDRERVAQAARSMMNGVTNCRIDYRVTRRDGEVRDIHMEAESILDEQGAPVSQRGTIQDVTALRRTEAALEDSEASLRNAQRIARMGSWDWHIVEGVLRWSDEIYRLFGMEPHAFPATYEAFLGHIHPEDRELVEMAVAKALSDDEPYSIDHRILLADGSVKFVHEQAEVIRDSTGQPVRMSGTVHDVSELHHAETALRKSEDSLRRAQHIAHIGSWDRDLKTGLLSWSDEMYSLFGLDKDETEPSLERLLEFVHPDDRDALRANIEEAIAGVARYNMDFRIIRPDGVEIILHAQGEVDRNSAGEPVWFRGTAQDVTDLRKAEAEVRRLNEELEVRVEDRTRELREAQVELIKKNRLATLGQLTATVSHELRNPLGVMRTSAYVLGRSLLDENESARKAMARIDRGITRCDRIIDELLDFTRSTEVDLEPVTIDNWIKAVLPDITLPVGVTLETDFRLGNLASMIDSGRMRRAVINIVENACQAMAGAVGSGVATETGIVTVSTGEKDGNIEIRIADSGPGIPADIREKIFEPLFSTKNFGVGLGLPTVRQILEQHGGSVTLESELGVGTLFRLAFPFKAPGAGQKSTIGSCFPSGADVD